ncbi:MAG: hypothetical protein ACQESK_06965 [Bacteroidota bacterium]
MKKLLFAIALISIMSVELLQAQSYKYRHFETTVHLGLPLEEVESYSNLVYGLEMGYTFFPNTLEVFDFGLMTGISIYNGEDVVSEQIIGSGADAGFLKLGVMGKLRLANHYFFGLDAGYAVGLDGPDGGPFYQPKIGYDSGKFIFDIYYHNIRTTSRFPNYSSFGIGFGFRL